MSKPKKRDPFHGHKGHAQHAALRHSVAHKAHRQKPNLEDEPTEEAEECWKEYSDKAKDIFGAVKQIRFP